MVHSLSSETHRKIKQLEIYTRRMLSGSLSGDNRSAVKGTGFDFDQIREYQQGDDVRFIDWSASARSDKLLLRQYMQERSRTILLMVDVSASSFWGSGATLKHETAATIASVLALVALYGNDKVGLILFSDRIELYMPPAQGREHIHRIMQNVFDYKPAGIATNISSALKKLISLKRKDMIVFCISDFIDKDFATYLPLVARKSDFIAVRCLDVHEKTVPYAGFITIEDVETGEKLVLDARKKRSDALQSFFTHRNQLQEREFRKCGVSLIDVSDRKDFMPSLIRFFRRRMLY
jgi:uncharacterized protein (DUF58 family)